MVTQEEVISLWDMQKVDRKQPVRRTASDASHQHQQLPAVNTLQLSQVKANFGLISPVSVRIDSDSFPRVKIIVVE